MPGTNSFYPYGESSTNILSNAQYQTDPERTVGAQERAIARSEIYNKAMRQGSAGAYAVAALVASSGKNAADNSATILAGNFAAAINWQARHFVATAATLAGTTLTATVPELATTPKADIPALFTVMCNITEALPGGAVFSIASGLPGVVLQYPIYVDTETQLDDDQAAAGIYAVYVDTVGGKAYLGGGSIIPKEPLPLPSLLPNFAAEQIDENTVDLSADKVPAEDNPYLDSATWTYLSGDVYPAGPDDGTAIQLTREEITYSTAAAASARAAVTTLGEKAAGDIVKLNESGSPVEFYVAKQDYESELNGAGRTLLARKDVYDRRQWNSANVNSWADSTILSWLNDTYKALLDADIQEAMGTTTYRYTPGNGNNTVSTRSDSVFLLSLTELGQSFNHTNVEGSALPIASMLQVAHRNGGPTYQWTRSPSTFDSEQVIGLNLNDNTLSNKCTSTFGSRPCFTLPSTLGVDADGNIIADDGRIHKQISWTQGTPLTARQFTYNENGDVQDTLEGAIAQVGGAPADLSEVFGENSWSTIKWACENDHPYVDSWLVGDSKDETIGGEVLTFVILGKDHDDRADGSGKAKLSIGMKDCMAQKQYMQSDGGVETAGSFVGSWMYTTYLSGIYNNLPEDLKSTIVSVSKKTAQQAGNSSIRTDAMNLWLLSGIEIFGDNTYTYPGEGTQYDYYATAANRVKRLSNGAGNANGWWTRSPLSSTFGSSTPLGFMEVDRNGGQNNDMMFGTTGGVSFNFCIG